MEPNLSIRGNVHDLPLLSYGVSSMVYEVSKSAVIKAPCGTDESRHHLAIERIIYERLGSHPYITKVLSIHKNMLVLERLQYPLRKRLWDLRNAGQLPLPQDVLRWATQIAQALQHAHSCGVLQVDIGPHNVLLDWAENAKLSDFAGSSIDGSVPSVLPSTRSEHPNIQATNPSRQSEIFALGSTLYEMETTQQPYDDKTDTEIERLFSVGDFPNTSALLLGKVIMKCWKVEYMNIGEAIEDIMYIQEKLKSKRSWWRNR